MLSTIKCTKNKKFSFYVKAEVFDEIELVISDGLKVWINNDEINERKITYESRPSSRKKETKLSYLNSVKNAIIVNPEATTLPNTVEYSYEMTETEGGILNFTIKEKLPNTTLVTVLYKGSFIDKLLLPNETSVSSAENNPLMEFLDTLGSVMHQKHKSIQDLENNNKDYQQLIDQNVADIKLLNEWKENLQNQMISKMCVVLNSKKREIQQLREQLGEAPTGSRGRRTGAAAAEPEEEKEIDEPAAKPKAARGRKPAAAKPAAAAAAPKRTARKTNLDKIQSNIKATANKRTTAAAKKNQLSDDEEEEAEFEDDEEDDEEEDNAMELDLQSDSTNTDDGDLLHSSDESGHENEIPKRTRAKRGGKAAANKKKSATTTTTSTTSAIGGDSGKGFDFERIKRLAEQFDKKDSHNSTSSATTATAIGKNKRTAAEANEDSDATVDDDDGGPPMKKKFLVNPKNVKEVDGSQIVGFLSSQGAGASENNNKSHQATSAGGGKDDDETNDEASVQVPVAAPPKKTQMENKKSKSRKLLEVSDDD
jgi:hypothetical protein